ncbi:transglutaminase family protein [Aliishimia ponticola]|uniref:Transglutaminase family protein n=1 Tax=Aliishimia ponticola TaxID=2499833 RepID=A0A4S4NA53_9RHOB|nr:transglutaminase family protein [Aliishimia ponticola]THH35307.1 transglutaminase family protein [Aliishimia ponticola]
MILNIKHVTEYAFEDAHPYGLQQLRLTPKNRPGQTVLDWDLEVTGANIETVFTDHHANTVTLLSFEAGTEKIGINAHGRVETEDLAGVTGKHSGFVPEWLFKRSTSLTRAGANVRSLAKGLKDEYESEVPLLHALSERILEAVPYKIGATESRTTADEAIEKGEGVCQDHAHIFVAAARSLGFPARYVSGYLLLDEQENQDATHAWAEALVSGIGWIGFDVSNGICPDARYVRVATGLDYQDAAPVTGLRFGTGSEAIKVEIQVQQQ